MSQGRAPLATARRRAVDALAALLAPLRLGLASAPLRLAAICPGAVTRRRLGWRELRAVATVPTGRILAK
eukprot:4502055-Pyramimonas_sp.AAC.1